jgi:hypothetical protein
MLQVSADVVLPASFAAASWFISINPIMSVVIKTQACRWFLCFRRLRRANSEFEEALMEIMDATLDVEVQFNSRRKNA